VGKVRQNNEDCLLMLPDIGLYLVCDGMGGHSSGELASKLAVETINAEIRNGKELKKAILAAHHVITGLQPEDKQMAGKPGSTVVALQIKGGSWRICWVGDSRSWVLQKGKMEQLTVDHTVVQQMVNWGDISEEEALTHPDRNRLSQAFGSRDEPPVVGCVDGSLASGMRFLLATDGMALWNAPAELAKVLGGGTVDLVVERLIDLSLAEGGKDNVSCVVVSS
jgi:protein phosphatase